MTPTTIRPIFRLAVWAPALAAALLAGCGTLSNVTDAGTTDNPVFPDVKDLQRPANQNTRPTAASLQALGPGMNREQLYAQIGPPQFAEGFRVREWDYAFTLPAPGGGERVCQLKVLFDKDRIARSLLWKPEGCGHVTGATAAPSS